MQQPLVGLPEAGRLIRERMEKGRVALLFGSEKRGLSNEDMSYCHWLLKIPTREEHRSMNLGQAAAVCLYETSNLENRNSKLQTQNTESVVGSQPAKMETVERLTEVWLEALEKSGYVGVRARSTAEEKLRRMLRRFAMEEVDAEVVLGMMKKIVGKLEKE